MLENKMMAEKVFAEGVAKNIRNFLPPEYQDAEFQAVQTNKNNGVVLAGIQVRLPQQNIRPIIYVESYFNKIRHGAPVAQVMNQIAESIKEASRNPIINSEFNLMDYDSFKEYLAVMLVNTRANRNMLQEMPHETIEDLSAICYVDLPIGSDGSSVTMKVKNDHLALWNVDKKEVFRQARENEQPANIPIFCSIGEKGMDIVNIRMEVSNLLDENVSVNPNALMYALTNMKKNYGASMITQPEVLQKLEQIFPDGFYVLPSSIHEVLILPDDGWNEPKMLGETVREANQKGVDRQEVLSDRVYSYDKDKHQIRQEPESIQRRKELER